MSIAITNIAINNAISNSDMLQVYHIWNSVYPAQSAYKSIDEFQKYLAEAINQTHYIVRTIEGAIGGWSMTFLRNKQRNFVLLVNKNMQNQGIGAKLVSQMKNEENEVIGWVVMSDNYFKLDRSPYHSPIKFYQRFGFTITDDIWDINGMTTRKIHWQKNEMANGGCLFSA